MWRGERKRFAAGLFGVWLASKVFDALWDNVVRPLLALNVEQWAVKHGYDQRLNRLLDTPGVGHVMSGIAEIATAFYALATGGYAFAFILGCLFIAFFDWVMWPFKAIFTHIGSREGEHAAAPAAIGQMPGEVQAQEPHATPLVFDVENQRKLIEALKRYAGNQANVKILFTNVKHRGLSDTLISIFELAGWETNLTKVPLDSYRHEYYEEIEIRGYNKHLVNAICEMLKGHGLPYVKPIVDSHQIKKDNSKWNGVQHNIKITIGHH